MILKIFSIYDTKAKAYLPPFFVPQDGQAIREFSNAVNSETHNFAKNPEDYTLIGLGEFDDENGVFTQYDKPAIQGTGISFVNTGIQHEKSSSET